jgi:hypothetical protein
MIFSTYDKRRDGQIRKIGIWSPLERGRDKGGTQDDPLGRQKSENPLLARGQERHSDAWEKFDFVATTSHERTTEILDLAVRCLPLPSPPHIQP